MEHIDWWEFEYETFQEDMRYKGIDVERMYFSGFWSQGDGACFDGRIDDAREFLNAHFKPEEYPMIRAMLKMQGSLRFSVQHSGHYYHENCTSFSFDADTFEVLMPAPTEFHEQVIASMDEQLNNEIGEFEKASIEIFKNYMRDLYKRLESEYESQTSDEAVTDAIIANDLNDDDEGE